MTSVDVGMLLGVITISVAVEEDGSIVIVSTVLISLVTVVDDISVTEGIGSTNGNNLNDSS